MGTARRLRSHRAAGRHRGVLRLPDRRRFDDGYFGAYAATNPEEDFAEAFSAYVFDLEAMTDGQQDRLDWIDARPGLAEFRDRARAAGLTPLENRFDICGF